MIDLENKSFCIFGLNDSGKSTLANYILQQFGEAAFVYDIMNEYRDGPYDRYVPSDRKSGLEFETVLRAVMTSRRYRLILIDEANRFCPSKPHPLPQAIADLNDWRAHWGLATGYIARLPVQLNQDLTQLAHYLFIFRIPGIQSTDYLNDISAGLGDTSLALDKYHFVVADAERRYTVFKPIPRQFATNKGIGTKLSKTPSGGVNLDSSAPGA